MNTNSPTTLPCAGCSRYLGDVMQPLVLAAWDAVPGDDLDEDLDDVPPRC